MKRRLEIDGIAFELTRNFPGNWDLWEIDLHGKFHILDSGPFPEMKTLAREVAEERRSDSHEIVFL